MRPRYASDDIREIRKENVVWDKYRRRKKKKKEKEFGDGF
jgi:hypothetical protein